VHARIVRQEVPGAEHRLRRELIVWLQFIFCTTLILFSGSKLSFYGDVIAEKTGMGRTWIGIMLMASVTSLPELMTGSVQ
jgi:cation:H+ antiporter